MLQDDYDLMFFRKDKDEKQEPESKKPEDEVMPDTEQEEYDTHDSTSDTTESEYQESTDEYDVESDLDSEVDRYDSEGEGKGLRVILKEKNTVEMDFNGDKIEKEEETPSTGLIKVQNTGSTNRITGVNLELDNIVDIESDEELQENTYIGVLAPGRDNDFTFNYSFHRDLEPIKVEQSYYDPESGLSPNFLGGMEKDFETKITITNTSEESIFAIKGNKTLNDLATLQDTEITEGEISSEGNNVTFDIEEIEAGGSVEIILRLSAALPDDVPAYEAGDLTVNYEHRDNLTSGITYQSVDGVSDFKRRIRRRQRETEPSFYDCEIFLENKSEFVYDLQKFSVYAGNLESQQMILDWDGEEASAEERELGPSENVSFEYVFESLEGTPSFGDQIEFSVYTEEIIAAETEITIHGRELKFMAIDITKSFLDENGEEVDEYEIPSYVETSIPILVTLTGVGTYPLEGLQISDEIPEGFRPENVDEVVVMRNGEELTSDLFEVSVGSAEIPESKSSSSSVGDFDETDETDEFATGEEETTSASSTSYDDHRGEYLIVKLQHLEETDEGGFDKDETISVKYVAIADQLEPKDDSIRVQAHGEGFIYEDESSKVYAHSDLEGLNLVVVHKRDDVDISKYISARDHNGQDAYRIELEAENFGSSIVDMDIEDLIPVGFELVEGSIELD